MGLLKKILSFFRRKKSEPILVVVPYLARAAQGRELELAVAGWRKHFKERFHIVVVGDYHPITDSGDDISFINCPRVKRPSKGNYWAHIDHVNKFRTVYAHYPETKGFIYTCDDIYAVKDFTMEDVMKPKARLSDIKGSINHPNSWVSDNFKTKLLLQRLKLPTMNWVCHLPVYYEWDKLLGIYDRFHCDKKSYVVEQIYFNMYYADSDYVVIEEEPNDYQVKVWDKRFDVSTLQNIIGKKMWVSNSMKGWTSKMEDVLIEHYGI